MAVPHVSGAFGDLLDPRFQKIFYETYKALPSMLPELYNFATSNGRNNMMWSSVGTVPDFSEFAGTVTYQSQSQGYDTTATPIEFTNGIQVERKLFDDDQYHIMDQKPQGLARAAARTRERDGARLLNNAFTVDTRFAVNTENVALCSNTHTTTSGASTATGFDNLSTAALSATSVAAARIQFVDFRGDQAERISLSPDEIWFPPALYEIAFEIVESMGKVETDLNNRNVHNGAYRLYEWNYLNDTNNWFMCDSAMRKQYVFWSDRIPLEFAMIEDFDTFIAKWRAYMRYFASVWVDWRWVLGSQVA